MRIIRKCKMPDGTALQQEDWHQDYPGAFASEATVAAYPVSKQSIWSRRVDEDWESCSDHAYPRRGSKFRLDMQFNSCDEAVEAMRCLESGEKRLQDYAASFLTPPLLGRDDILFCLGK